MLPSWLIVLIVTLVGAWALATYVSTGLAAIWVIIGLIIVVMSLHRGRV